ncbi:MAG: hypothetical protein WBF02_18575, partial [Xanthobacteraceae bacterium]
LCPVLRRVPHLRRSHMLGPMMVRVRFERLIVRPTLSRRRIATELHTALCGGRHDETWRHQERYDEKTE